MSHSDHSCCNCPAATGSVAQTLDEMDFERGPWSAALDGEMERVERYLRDGGDPNATDSSGYKPMHYAARNGHLDICELLGRHGASVNANTRSGGVTPLHRACYCGHEQVTSFLLKHGAHPAECDSDGKTALHKAAERGHISVVRLLLSKDASLLSMQDNREHTAADCLPNNADPQLVKVLQSTGKT